MSGGRLNPGNWKMFASLAVRNYRHFFIGALISNVGAWVQSIGQAWLVLTVLTDNSSGALGMVTAMQFIALPFLAPYAGSLTDRVSKRGMLMVTQSLLCALTFGLFILVQFEWVQLWHVYVFAAAQGAVAAFDNPARQAFVAEIVDRQLLPNAVALNSTSFNSARLVGPGIAGLLIGAFGIPLTLLLNAISFVAMLIALFAMDPHQLESVSTPHGRGAAKEGLKYLAKRPDLLILLTITFMMGSFAMHFQIFNATMTTTVFHSSAEAFGLLGTIMAIGTLAGALSAARRTKPTFRIIMYGMAGFAVSTALLAVAPNYLVYSILLVPVGFFAITVMISCNASVQLGTAPEFRGRVMAVYMAIFVGGTPLGAPLVGWVGEAFGARASIFVSTGVAVATVIGVMTYLMWHEGIRLRFQKGHIHVWRVNPEVD